MNQFVIFKFPLINIVEDLKKTLLQNFNLEYYHMTKDFWLEVKYLKNFITCLT